MFSKDVAWTVSFFSELRFQLLFQVSQKTIYNHRLHSIRIDPPVKFCRIYRSPKSPFPVFKFLSSSIRGSIDLPLILGWIDHLAVAFGLRFVQLVPENFPELFHFCGGCVVFLMSLCARFALYLCQNFNEKWARFTNRVHGSGAQFPIYKPVPWGRCC